MLVSAAETTLQTSSNSLFAFFFCNLIVLVIFIGAKSGSTDSGARDAQPVFGIHYDVKQAEIVDVERFSSDQIVRSSRPEKQVEEKLALAKVTEVCQGEIKNDDNIIECTDENEKENENFKENENKEDDGEEVNDDEDDNGDDELRRRIEDFIAKVNREWEAENLKERMHPLISEDAPN